MGKKGQGTDEYQDRNGLKVPRWRAGGGKFKENWKYSE